MTGTAILSSSAQTELGGILELAITGNPAEAAISVRSCCMRARHSAHKDAGEAHAQSAALKLSVSR